MIQNEQKPDSAEFRTLDKMVDEIQERLIDLMLERCYPDYSEIMGWLTEAEARGAAEQRRKDAEGGEVRGWTYELRPQGHAEWNRVCHVRPPILGAEYVRDLQPLYTRPANVAVLEARVKELEGEKHANKVAAFERGFQGGRRDRYRQYERETAEAVAAERERCAKACKDVRLNEISAPADWHNDACECCIRAIREGEQS